MVGIPPRSASSTPSGALAASRVTGPGFSTEAVCWLLDTGRLHRQGALGTDTFGPDVGTDADYTVSKLLYREHRISLECLGGLAALPESGAWVLAGGVITPGGTGSPATVFGLIDAKSRR